MEFSEIANRLTGISTPLGGLSWQPSELESAAARRIVAYLEDRRVLYAPDEMEDTSVSVRQTHPWSEYAHILRRRFHPALAADPGFFHPDISLSLLQPE